MQVKKQLQKLIGIAAAVSMMILSGCSETPYANTQGVNGVAYQNGTLMNGAQTGLYNNGLQNGYVNNGMVPSYVNSPTYVNPYLYSNYSNFNQANVGIRAGWMFSLNLRANPSFYYNSNTNTLNNNTCMYRRYPTYTENQCACVQAPCNCRAELSRCQSAEDIIAQIKKRRAARGGSESSDDVVISRSTTRSDTRSETRVVRTTETKIYPTIRLADARALYNHLAIKAEKVDKTIGQGSLRASLQKAGKNYVCYLAGPKENDSSYFCDLDIELKDGKVDEISTIGTSESPDASLAIEHLGSTANIKSDSTGTLTLADSKTDLLYASLPGEAIDGSYHYNGVTMNAKVKSGSQVKCYKLPTTSAKDAINCEVSINATTGEALSI